MDDLWWTFIFASSVYAWSVMTKIIKGYLFLIGLFSLIMGSWVMLSPNFISWYPAFDDIQRDTSLAIFVRTISGVFVASGYILLRFIFSSSKVQLGTVLIYLCAFTLVGKFCGFVYDTNGFQQHDVIASILGILTLIGLYAIHRHRKNLISYDL